MLIVYGWSCPTRGRRRESALRTIVALSASVVLTFSLSHGVEAQRAGAPAEVVARESAFFRLVTPDSLFVERAGKVAIIANAETPFFVIESGRDFESLIQRIDATK